MKKLIPLLFLLSPLLGCAQHGWVNAGVMQKTTDGKKWRIVAGNNGIFYPYTAIQTDSSIVAHLSGFTGGGVWGSITGVLSTQTDLQTALNAKQASGNYITALTGDGTASGPGSVAFTLATVNSNVGTYTNPSVTVNAKGLITAISSGSASGVSSVTNSDGTLTISPTSGAVVGSINLAHANTWSAAITATSFVKTGGTASQFLMANGSVTGPIIYSSLFAGAGTSLSPLTLNVDNNPALGSGNLIYSGGVYNALLVARNAANSGQTASEAVVAQYTDPGVGDNTYRVGCWINLLTVTGGDGLTIQVTYEDEHSVSKTKTFYTQGSSTASMTTADDYPFPTFDFRVLSGSTITISTTVTGSGSILYDAGGTISLLIGH